MSAEITVIHHLLATLRQIRRTQPDMAIATAALEEEKRLTEKVKTLETQEQKAA
jgi:hypothetical protein